jgi:hypothetical protein
MKIPVVYLAGPFRAPTNWEIVQNVRAAEEVSLQLWALGVAPICPHLNTANYQGALPDSTWLDGDIAILCKCDGVVMMPDWKKSVGSRGEHEMAEERQIPIFYWPLYVTTQKALNDAFQGWKKGLCS